jgi:hypothetical protein
MQIDKEGIQNLLMNMVLEKKKLKKETNPKKTYPCLFIWEWGK